MRIAFFHNWSWIGSALGRSLLQGGLDDLWMIGGNISRAERDPELIELARRHGVLQVAPKDIRAPQFARRLAIFQPDLIVVGTFARRLPKALLEIPKVAAINVHSSLLPAYRGALPEFWVIRRGERASGLTVHLMTEEFDAGNMLAQTKIPVTDEDNLLTISMRLAEAAVPLLTDVLARYRKGERPLGEPQDESKVSGAPLVREEHLRIVWTESAHSIECLVRAAFPVFDAYAYWSQDKLILRAVRRVPDAPKHLLPGEIYLDHQNERLLVGTGDGVLWLGRVERRGDGSSGYRFAERIGMGKSPGERLE